MQLHLTMKIAFVLAAAVLCGQGQTPPAGSDYVQSLDGLNAMQLGAVEDYIRQNEKPIGEFRVLADRKRIAVLSTEALRVLFREYRFVTVTWIYEVDPAALHEYSVPGPTVQTLVLDGNGRNCMPKRTGYWEEFGDLLRVAHVRVTDGKSAALVRAALIATYGTGMSSDDLRKTDAGHEGSQWLLGYQEFPFRPISSDEEIREASYYLITVDAGGVVASGRLVNQVLERRRLQRNEPRR